MASDKNWIQKAIKNPGSLRRKAGVKKGEKISGKELNKLAKSKNATTRRQANLAKTLKKMDEGGRTGKTQQREAPDVAGMTVKGKSTPRPMSGLPPKTTTTTVQADVATPKAEGAKPRGSGVAIQGIRPARNV